MITTLFSLIFIFLFATIGCQRSKIRQLKRRQKVNFEDRMRYAHGLYRVLGSPNIVFAKAHARAALLHEEYLERVSSSL
jgi:hypothetical protein